MSYEKKKFYLCTKKNVLLNFPSNGSSSSNTTDIILRATERKIYIWITVWVSNRSKKILKNI